MRAARAAEPARTRRQGSAGPVAPAPAPCPAPEGAGTDWAEAWAAALGALELDVDRCEHLLRAIHHGSDLPTDSSVSPWSPPTGLGPMPESLEERARTVLARQLEVAGGLAAAAAQSRQQIALVDRLGGGAAPARPMYVDAVL